MYLISNYCPRRDVSCGRHYFTIYLHPDLKKLVAASGITQDHIHTLLEGEGQAWLDSCGFDAMFDPDNCGYDADRNAPLGPRAYKLYRPGCSLRIGWGEWGPEHIEVPGNACALDIEHDRHSFGCPYEDGNALLPHNIDNWFQKNLLTMAFTRCIELVTWLAIGRQHEHERELRKIAARPGFRPD